MFGIPNNPLAQVLSLLVFGALLVVAVVMGAVLLAAVFGFAVLAWIAFSVRVWWLSRKYRAAAQNRTPDDRASKESQGLLIDAEYTVIEERDARRGPRDPHSP